MRWERLGYSLLLLTCASCPLLIDRQSIEPFGSIKFLALGGGGLLLSVWLACQPRPLAFFKTPIGFLMGLCLLSAFVSSWQALTPEFTAAELMRLSLLVILGAAAHQITWTHKRLLILTGCLSLGALVNGIFVLAEHFDWSWKLYQQKGRLIGLFGYQNIIAQFMIIPTTFLIYFFTHNSKKFQTLISLPCIFLLAILTLLLCRGAWLGCGAGLFYLFFISKERKAVSKIKGLFLIISGITLGLFFLDAPTDNHEDGSATPLAQKKDLKTLTRDSGRSIIYRQTLTAIQAHWGLGAGPGNYPVIYQLVDRDRGDFRRYAHNDLLQWTTETGLVGLLILTSLIGVVIRKLFLSNGLQAAVGSGLLATAAHSMVSYNFYVLAPATLAAVFLGILSASSQKNTTHPPTPVLLRFSFLALSLIALIKYSPKVFGPIQSSRLQAQANQYFSTAPTSYEDSANRHRKAANLYSQANALNPHDPSLIWQLSQSLLASGQHAKGRKQLELLQRLTPGNDRVHLQLAHLYARDNNVLAQVESLEKARVVLPHSRPLLDELWLLYSHLGPKHATQKTHLESVYKDQGWWEDHKPHWVTRWREGATREELINTEIYLSDRLRVQPDDIESQAQLGSVRYQLGFFNESLECYLKVLHLLGKNNDKDSQLLYDSLVATTNICHTLSQENKGYEFISKGLENFPNDSFFFSQAFRYQLGRQDIEMALSLLNPFPQQHKKYRNTRLKAAQLLADWNPHSKVMILEGLDLHNQLVENLSDAQSYLDRGDFILEYLQDRPRALENYQQGLEKQPLTDHLQNQLQQRVTSLE